MKKIVLLSTIVFLTCLGSGCPSNYSIGQYRECDEVEVEIIKKRKRGVYRDTRETLECLYCDKEGCHKVLM